MSTNWQRYCEPENWHEAANIFPLIGGEEFSELAEDISSNGLQNPVVLWAGKVLDGRNRLLACRNAGVEPSFVDWTEKAISPLTWVISQNLRRRNLTASQKAAIAFEILPMLETEARGRQSLGGKAAGRGRPGKVRANLPRPNRARRAAADIVGVGDRYVSEVKKIAAKAPSMIMKIKNGELSIADAQRQLGFKQSTLAMVSADSNEWFTPESYIKAAREVLGAFDLDPASCATANRVVKARKYFTQEDDGLSKQWTGRVWLNPPYGDVGPKFVAKLLQEIKNGNVTEAILLVNSHCTDARWFKPLFSHLICFTDHRSRFWTARGEGGSPTHGSAIVYLGSKQDEFIAVFSKLGTVVTSAARNANEAEQVA